MPIDRLACCYINTIKKSLFLLSSGPEFEKVDDQAVLLQGPVNWQAIER